MKNRLLISLLLTVVILVSCKLKPKSEGKESVTSVPLIEIAQKKFPGITQENLSEGESIFTNDCSSCHGIPKIKSRNEIEWIKVIDWMAPKAKLDDAKKKKLLEFVLSSRAQIDQQGKK